MNINIDNLKKLIESIRSISLFQRLFSWGKIRQQLIDAVSDIQKMESSLEQINKENELISNELNLQTAKLDAANDIVSRYDGEKERLNYIIEDRGNRLTKIEKEISTFQNENENLKDALQKSSADFATLKQRFEWLEESFSKINQENTEFKAEEKNKREKYEQDVAGLNAIRDQIQNDRNKEQEDRLIAETEKRNTLKETWSKHQTNVKGLIKNICQKHTIEYVDAVPFKGEPDNTIKICDEFVVFDAKSPGSDDLSNFPTYIKTQAESAKKYAKHDNVKSDIFFVVPTNTLERLSQFVFNLADYNVFVISVDALEQIILSLKKIEEYEFADQLSPEERDNICRVLGKFAHLTKRRIQIDSFFAKQFIELAYKTEADLPKDILDKVVEFERSEKLNPPQEKRVKAINTKDLEKDLTKINNEAFSKGIVIDDTKISDGLNELDLYKPEDE
jgi:hypothetical protein